MAKRRVLLASIAAIAVSLGVVVMMKGHPTLPAIAPIAFRTSPLAVPTYEPVQFNGRDAASPAQKEKFQAILSFATADMERRHVSPRKFNQFLWQMHFFIPVQYKPFDCTALVVPEHHFRIPPRQETLVVSKGTLKDRANDFISMANAMADLHRAFPLSLPAFNSEAQASGGDVSDGGLHENDDLQVYSWLLVGFNKSYRYNLYTAQHDNSYTLRDGVTKSVIEKGTSYGVIYGEMYVNDYSIDPSLIACQKYYADPRDSGFEN